MNPLSEAQRILLGMFTIALALILIWGYGQWQHHEGYQQRADEDKVVVDKQKKEAHDAAIADQQQADSDRAVLIDYYNGLLSSRPKLQPRSGQANNPSGVLSATNWCEPLEEHLRSEEEAAENTAKLLRVRQWGKRLGLQPESASDIAAPP